MWKSLLLVACTSVSLSAQNADGVVPGARVRFQLVDMQSPEPLSRRAVTIRGTVAQASADSLVVQVGGTAGTVSVNRLSIGNLAVSRGVGRAWNQDRRRLVMASASVLVSGIMIANARKGPGSPSRLYPMAAVNLALVGAMLTQRVERWEEVGASARSAAR
jgi:hypothetical protein